MTPPHPQSEHMFQLLFTSPCRAVYVLPPPETCHDTHDSRSQVSGPAARLVHPDPSASENGDHPFCLVFHTGSDDSLLALGAVAADHLAGVAEGGGGRSGAAEDVVSCKVVRKTAQPGAGSRGGAAPTGRRGGGGRGQSRSVVVVLFLSRLSWEII